MYKKTCSTKNYYSIIFCQKRPKIHQICDSLAKSMTIVAEFGKIDKLKFVRIWYLTDSTRCTNLIHWFRCLGQIKNKLETSWTKVGQICCGQKEPLHLHCIQSPGAGRVETNRGELHPAAGGADKQLHDPRIPLTIIIMLVAWTFTISY